MDKPHFVVPVADLTSAPRRLSWEISDTWLRWALSDTDAVPRNSPGELAVELARNGQQVIVRGQAHVALSMPCARTLEPVEVELTPDIFLVLEQAPPAEKVRHRAKSADGGAQPARRSKKRKGPGWRDTPLLPQETAAQDSYEGEQVVLDKFLREYILLELPMSPVRSVLPNDPEPARGDTSSSEGASPVVDPRLMPLLALKTRLQKQKE